MFEFTASHSGCCGFYTKQTILYTQPTSCPCPPLEPVLLGKHSALQEETTVVLPCYRKVALRYMRFHLKLTQSTCRNVTATTFGLIVPNTVITVTQLGSIAPNLLSQPPSSNRFDRSEVLSSQRERI